MIAWQKVPKILNVGRPYSGLALFPYASPPILPFGLLLKTGSSYDVLPGWLRMPAHDIVEGCRAAVKEYFVNIVRKHLSYTC